MSDDQYFPPMRGMGVDDTIASLFEEYNSIEGDDRPSSLIQCAIRTAMTAGSQQGDGSMVICPIIYKQFVNKSNELDELDYLISEKQSVEKKKARAKRTVKALRPFYFDDQGNVCYINPKQTFWFLMYLQDGVDSAVTQTDKGQAKFRRRFRMPHASFTCLLHRIQTEEAFAQWLRPDAVGREPSPLGLLLLGALRYLGRGLTFDDLEESTAIGEETQRVFFHAFIQCGKDSLHPEYIRMPTTAAEHARHQFEFNEGCLTGAAFSTDATNVVMWRCSHGLKQAHTGFKQSHPARSFNLSTNHRGEIIHSAKGHPSRWNDKTLACHDDFVLPIKEGKILQDVTFILVSRNPTTSQIEETSYCGAWGLTDNGHHKWSCAQAPAKINILKKEARLSEWIESFRKDVECVFGILKGRWRILQTGIRLHSVEATDDIWLTCCAPHNMLLEIDGLDQPWAGSLGDNNPEEMRKLAPFSLRRLHRFDSSSSASYVYQLREPLVIVSS